MARYQITLTCDGLTEAEGSVAIPCLFAEFDHRPWHENVKCRWVNGALQLEAGNDYDADGKALLDEFRDTVVACVKSSGDLNFGIVSVRTLP